MTDAVLTALALLCLLAALLPAVLAAVNLFALRRPAPEADPGLVSILIPARNEAANIAGTVRAALASSAVPVEVIVGDDHSTDETAAIVRGLGDPRLRVVPVPPLPEGWTGKNHACAHIAGLARGRHLLFIDADVRLEPEAAAALAARARRGGAALVSGVPRQRTETLGELLTVPMIDFLLVGYLPVPLMRRRSDPSLGAACGQMILIERAAYEAIGGHAAIRAFLHDGVRLPGSCARPAIAPTWWRARPWRPAGCTGASRKPGPGSPRTPTRAWPRRAPCRSGPCSWAAASWRRPCWSWPACSAWCRPRP